MTDREIEVGKTYKWDGEYRLKVLFIVPKDMVDKEEEDLIVGVTQCGRSYLVSGDTLGPEVFQPPKELWVNIYNCEPHAVHTSGDRARADASCNAKATAVRYVLADDQGGE